MHFVNPLLVEDHKLVELLEQVDLVQEVVIIMPLEQQVMKDVIHHQKEMLVEMEYLINVILTLVVAEEVLVEPELMVQKHLTQLVQLAEEMVDQELMFLQLFQEHLIQEYMLAVEEVEFFHQHHLMVQ